MADPNNTSDNAGTEGDAQKPHEASKGPIHNSQPDTRSADLQHNQAAAVRGSGDQNPSDTYPSDRDRRDTPGTTPG